jgi:hypothetical protein
MLNRHKRVLSVIILIVKRSKCVLSVHKNQVRNKLKYCITVKCIKTLKQFRKNWLKNLACIGFWR